MEQFLGDFGISALHLSDECDKEIVPVYNTLSKVMQVNCIESETFIHPVFQMFV